MRRKMRRVLLASLGGIICAAVSLAAHAADNPLAPYLSVPGAMTTLPVGSAKMPFPLDFAQDGAT